MIFKEHYNGTMESVQIVLTALREKDYNSQAQAVRLIMSEMKLSLVEADKIVMNSNAWRAEKKGNEIFREEFKQMLESDEALIEGNDEPGITIIKSEMGIAGKFDDK